MIRVIDVVPALYNVRINISESVYIATTTSVRSFSHTLLSSEAK